MAAARFWRISGVSTWGGGDLQMSELHLHDASGRVDGPATLTCSHAPVAGTLSDLRDSTTATMCSFGAADVRSAGFWLQWDFGSGGERDIVAINLGSGASQATCPEVMTVESAAVGSGWLNVLTLPGIQYPGPQAMTLLEPGNLARAVWDHLGPSAFTLDLDRLEWTCSDYTGSAARAGIAVQSGNWYWELTVNLLDTSGSSSTNALNIGVWPVSRSLSTYIYETSGVLRVYPNVAVGDVIRCAFNASAGTLAIYRNATLLGIANGQPLSMSEPWAPVIGDDNAGGARVTANFGASPFAFAVPAGYSPLASGGLGVGSRPVRSARDEVAVAAAAPDLGGHTVAVSALAVARDVEFGGQARIWGTTKIKGTPNVPTKARVVLQHQRSKVLVRETWSDPVTGAFEFSGLDASQQFLTLVEDLAGNFRPVAASKLVPEVLA